MLDMIIKVALYKTADKRVEKDRLRAEKFGVDLNEVVSASVLKYTKQ